MAADLCSSAASPGTSPAYAWVDVPGALPLSPGSAPTGSRSSWCWPARRSPRRSQTPPLGAARRLLAGAAAAAPPGRRAGACAAALEDIQEAGGVGAGVPVRLMQPNIANLTEWDPVRGPAELPQGDRPLARAPASRAPWWSGRRARPGRSPMRATRRCRTTCSRWCETRLHGAVQLQPSGRGRASTTRPILLSPAGAAARATTSGTWCRSGNTCRSAASSPGWTSWRATPASSGARDRGDPAALGPREARHGDLLRGGLPGRGGASWRRPARPSW